jgi:membrane-associated phospholipid phosphatase
MTPSIALSMPGQYLGDAGDFLLINRFARRTGCLHGFMTFYAATLGITLLVLLLAAGWWLARRRRDPRVMASLVWAGVGTLVAVGVNQPIVNTVAERRPYQSIPHVLLLVSRSSDYGFPSDHATMAGAVAAGLCYVNRRLGITAWVVAALLAFARVYVGAHYPHDVAAGLLLGAAVIVAGHYAARSLLTPVIRRLSSTPLRPLLTAGPGAQPLATASRASAPERGHAATGSADPTTAPGPRDAAG